MLAFKVIDDRNLAWDLFIDYSAPTKRKGVPTSAFDTWNMIYHSITAATSWKLNYHLNYYKDLKTILLGRILNDDATYLISRKYFLTVSTLCTTLFSSKNLHVFGKCWKNMIHRVTSRENYLVTKKYSLAHPLFCCFFLNF